ncbi:MAG: hypothetical protein IPL61_04975 [Myxococcales bacterium]|nr:hypothetical protein [Myxococcales bacterium]
MVATSAPRWRTLQLYVSTPATPVAVARAVIVAGATGSAGSNWTATAHWPPSSPV